MKLLTAAFAILFASTALADEVVLRNGHRVVGIQSEVKDRIVVETGYGTVSFPREEVVSVTKGETPLHAWPVRYAEIEKSTNASDFTKLAAWARENGMPRYVGGLMRRALELDPENAEARAALGYVRHNGRWMTEAEHRKSQGQVQEGGRWMNSLEKQLQERRRIESESRRLDRESEKRQKEERRRQAREDAQLQARILAAQSAPIAFDGRWFRNGRSWGYGYWGVDDLVELDWVLSFLNGGGIFPVTSLITGQVVSPSGRAVRPRSGGSINMPTLPQPLPPAPTFP